MRVNITEQSRGVACYLLIEVNHGAKCALRWWATWERTEDSKGWLKHKDKSPSAGINKREIEERRWRKTQNRGWIEGRGWKVEGYYRELEGGLRSQPMTGRIVAGETAGLSDDHSTEIEKLARRVAGRAFSLPLFLFIRSLRLTPHSLTLIISYHIYYTVSWQAVVCGEFQASGQKEDIGFIYISGMLQKNMLRFFRRSFTLYPFYLHFFFPIISGYVLKVYL